MCCGKQGSPRNLWFFLQRSEGPTTTQDGWVPIDSIEAKKRSLAVKAAPAAWETRAAAIVVLVRCFMMLFGLDVVYFIFIHSLLFLLVPIHCKWLDRE